MRERLFRFRQFAVHHQASAMKVGTDGVSLGAWAAVGAHTLEVGCGCGLIGLMAAQRGAGRVTMIDVDQASASETERNAEASPWTDRIEVHCADFLTHDFADSRFDAIICNPPFFATGERAPMASRATARHEGDLTPAAFFGRAVALMADGATVSIIVPTDRKAAWTFAASIHGLVPVRTALLQTKPDVAPLRALMEFAADATPAAEQVLRIDSADYQRMVEPFYLPKT